MHIHAYASMFAMPLRALAAGGDGPGQAREHHRARFEYEERLESVVQRYAARGSDGIVPGAQKIQEHRVFGWVERIG